MEYKNIPLFKKGSLSKPGQLLLSSHAYKKEQGQVIVQIYQTGLTQASIKNPKEIKQSIQFNFDVKFSFNVDPNQISFEKDQLKVIYSLDSQQTVQQWRNLLKQKLNQRGFHEQFKPLKKIGKGNFASVYLAQKLQNHTNFAVKAFSKEAAYSEDKGKQCLIKEIEVMRHLNHKNTMKLHEVFQSQNSLYIIFELLEGGQLYDKIKAKYKFKPQETQLIIKGILQGLRQMHQKNIMHRDLKPQNLLFRKQGDYDCVIADFGLAEFSDVAEYLFVRCGTPGYVAPEVINIKDMKSKYHPICDIFSLGLIFHVLLFGKSAFPGTTYNQVLSQNRACNIHFSEDASKRVGGQALDLLEKMLKKNPNQRISAKDALQHPYLKSDSLSTKHIEDLTQTQDSYPSIDSPLLTSANKKRLENKSIKKDSCLEFKMGKQNLMTGKTQTVGSVQSKLSGVDQTEIKKVKVSQFCVQKK